MVITKQSWEVSLRFNQIIIDYALLDLLLPFDHFRDCPQKKSKFLQTELIRAKVIIDGKFHADLTRMGKAAEW